MKEGKPLDRVQAVKLFYINLIIATIQEHCLKFGLACNIYSITL